MDPGMDFQSIAAGTENWRLNALFLSGTIRSPLAPPLVSRYPVCVMTDCLNGGEVKPCTIMYMRQTCTYLIMFSQPNKLYIVSTGQWLSYMGNNHRMHVRLSCFCSHVFSCEPEIRYIWPDYRTFWSEIWKIILNQKVLPRYLYSGCTHGEWNQSAHLTLDNKSKSALFRKCQNAAFSSWEFFFFKAHLCIWAWCSSRWGRYHWQPMKLKATIAAEHCRAWKSRGMSLKVIQSLILTRTIGLLSEGKKEAWD